MCFILIMYSFFFSVEEETFPILMKEIEIGVVW